jgi:hypothetical protein
MSTKVGKPVKPASAKHAGQLKDVKPVATVSAVRQPVSEAEVRLRAYHRWEVSGKPPGDGVNFWLEAEQEFLQGK